MLRGVLFALLLGTGAGAQGVKLAAPGLTGVGLDEALVGFYGEHLAQQLSLQGVRVITAREIGALLGLERQKQLLGCAEEANECMAELANALGSDGLLVGEVAKVGSSFQLNLKVLSSQDATKLSSFSAAAEDEERLLSELTRAAGVMSSEVAKRLGRTLTPDVEALSAYERSRRSVALRRWAWLPAAVGGALLVGGGAALLKAQANYRELDRPTRLIPLNEARTLRDDGATFQTLGLAGAGAGLAGVAAGATMLLLGSSEPTVQPSVGISPAGAFVSLQGSFP